MEVVTIPHPTLRKKANQVTVVDKRLIKFTAALQSTLSSARNPRGVGLAANQVNKLLAVFCARLDDPDARDSQVQVFINPTIIDHSDQLILGETARDKKPLEEGCLSMPGMWGAVPRWSQIKVQYQTVQSSELVTHTGVFHNFAARVIQHEIDHLHGILFTDHSLQHNLPVFRVTNGQWVEMDPQVLQAY